MVARLRYLKTLQKYLQINVKRAIEIMFISKNYAELSTKQKKTRDRDKQSE